MFQHRGKYQRYLKQTRTEFMKEPHPIVNIHYNLSGFCAFSHLKVLFEKILSDLLNPFHCVFIIKYLINLSIY